MPRLWSDGRENYLERKVGIMGAVHACSAEAATPHPLRSI